MEHHAPLWGEFLDCVRGLLADERVQSMREIRHHPGVSCYEHSLSVAHMAYRLATRWGLDAVACARAGLLHDFYLYDPRTLKSYRQCFAHPKAALENAWALCGSLSPKEENCIMAHMWPIAKNMPRCGEAFVVCLADKLCATAEVLCFRRMARRAALVYAFTTE